MPRYHTVLIDADNTLFDFDAAEHSALRQAMEERGLPFNGETEGRYLAINQALWSAFDRGEVTQPFLLVERFRLLAEELGAHWDPARFNEDYLTHLGEHSQLLPGAEELCRDLSRHCRVALATNGVARVQHARLSATPLRAYLSGVFISQELGVQKPQRAFFDAALKALGVQDRSGVVMVGDGLASDIRGGINAGLDTIWYNPKGLSAPADPLPTYIAHDYDHIRAVILCDCHCP